MSDIFDEQFEDNNLPEFIEEEMSYEFELNENLILTFEDNMWFIEKLYLEEDEEEEVIIIESKEHNIYLVEDILLYDSYTLTVKEFNEIKGLITN